MEKGFIHMRASLTKIWAFLSIRKKYWVPVVTVMAIFGILIIYTTSHKVTPYVYSLF
jgi:hypothetical protein